MFFWFLIFLLILLLAKISLDKSFWGFGDGFYQCYLFVTRRTVREARMQENQWLQRLKSALWLMMLTSMAPCPAGGFSYVKIQAGIASSVGVDTFFLGLRKSNLCTMTSKSKWRWPCLSVQRWGWSLPVMPMREPLAKVEKLINF